MLAALLLSGYIVFGDSQCIHGWPEMVTQEGTHYVQNSCLGGRQMVTLDLPDDLWHTAQIQTVVIALGGNDAIFGTHPEDYRAALQDAIEHVTSRGLEVRCVLPAYIAPVSVQPFRDIMNEECAVVWDIPIHTFAPDQIHPTFWASVGQAVAAKEYMDAE